MSLYVNIGNTPHGHLSSYELTCQMESNTLSKSWKIKIKSRKLFKILNILWGGTKQDMDIVQKVINQHISASHLDE